ncbi:MAG: hypothetical protein V3R87_02045 [Dehalococcoidia bacterium]
MSTDRHLVYKAIDSERDYQDSLWRDQSHPEHRNPLTIGEFILLVEQYTSEARAEWTVEPKLEIEALNVMRKIAGIATNCMEQHGAPQREGFER